MARNIGLANIYVKIRNKRALTIDDLVFLSIFDPECFKKTCSNLLYKLPEAKVLMEKKKEKTDNTHVQGQEEVYEPPQQLNDPIYSMFVSKSTLEQEKVEALLDNLKKMEWEGNVIKEIDNEKVKNLLGDLYMEMLFPHDDKVKYFCLEDHIECSLFNKKV